MDNNFLDIDPLALWDASEEEEQVESQFMDSSALASLQDVPYGQMLTQEEQRQVIEKGPEEVDFLSISPESLFADVDGSVEPIPQSGGLDRFVKNAYNAMMSPTYDFAELLYTYGPMSPMNMLSNAAQGKPLFEAPKITETLTYDVPEAQTRQQEIEDVAANSFGTIMSFVIPTTYFSRGAAAVGAIKNVAAPRLLAQNTPKAVLDVAGRPGLIARQTPERQAQLRSAYRSMLNIPVVGAATRTTRNVARRTDKAVKDFAEIRGDILPNLLSDYVNTPGKAIAFEALAATTAANGAAIAEAIAPGSIIGRIYGEMIGGLGSAVIAGPVARGVSTVTDAALSPRQTFQRVINKFMGDEKAALEVVQFIDDASRALLLEKGIEPTPEAMDGVKREMVDDILNMDEDLRKASKGIASGNPIVLALESRLAKADPDFARYREKGVMEAYNEFYSYIQQVMNVGSPNSVSAAARLQKAAFDSIQEREVMEAQSVALEAADKAFDAGMTASQASSRQYEMDYDALIETRKTELELWGPAVKNAQPDSAEAYSTSLRAYNEISGDRLPESESLSVRKDFDRMRDSATYAEVKKQLPELEAFVKANPENEDALNLLEAAKERLRDLELRYGGSGRNLRFLLKMGVPENAASLISGNSLDSIDFKYKGPTFTVKDIHNTRSKALSLARRFRKLGDAGSARNYEDLAEALLRDLIRLNDNSTEYLTAINFSRSLNQRWNKGFSGQVLRGVEMGTLSPEAVLERAFVKSSGLKTRLNFETLDRSSVPITESEIMGLEGPPTSEVSRGIQEDFLRSNLSRIVTKDGKTIDPKKLDRFLQDEEFVRLLKEMPNGILGDLKNARTSQAVVDDLIAENKITRDQLAQSALYNFLGKKNADRVLKTMLVERDASENFASLMRQLRHSARHLAERYKNVLREDEIKALNRSKSAALEGIKFSLFRLAHDVATSGDTTSFSVMKDWLESPLSVGEMAPIDLIRKNRVMTETELKNFMTYIDKGVDLQTRFASDEALAILEATEDPLGNLLLRISGANLGGAISTALSGRTSLIAQSAGSKLLTDAFSKMPMNKLQNVTLRMFQDDDFFIDVLNTSMSKKNPRQVYTEFRAFYLENGYLGLVSALDATAQEMGIAKITDPLIEAVEEQRQIQPSEMEAPLPSGTPEMEQRGLNIMRPQTQSLLSPNRDVDIESAREAITSLKPPVLSNVLTPEEPPEDRGAERYVVSDLKPEQKEIVQQFRPLWNTLEEQYNLPKNWLEVVAFIESSYDPQAIGRTNANAKGFFQFTPIALEDYPHDPFNPEQNSEAAARYASQNLRVLESGLGREPTAFELYLAHQQGGTGALNLLTAPPDALAAEVRNRVVIRGQNLDPDTTTVAQFIDKFKNRYESYARGIS